jgi:hypothetical protein
MIKTLIVATVLAIALAGCHKSDDGGAAPAGLSQLGGNTK